MRELLAKHAVDVKQDVGFFVYPCFTSAYILSRSSSKLAGRGICSGSLEQVGVSARSVSDALNTCVKTRGERV